MDLDLGPEIAEFRAQLRDWIAGNAPEGLAELADWTIVSATGGDQGAELARAAAHPAYAEGGRRLTDAKLICPPWPAGVGGPGLGGGKPPLVDQEVHLAQRPRGRRGAHE